MVGPAILGAGWCAAPAVGLVEDRGPIEALGRSWALSRGLRWQVFAALLVVSLAGAAVLFPVQLLVGAALGEGLSFGERMAITQVAVQLASAVSSSLLAVSFGVVYHQLRVATEGPETAHLGQVFE